MISMLSRVRQIGVSTQSIVSRRSYATPPPRTSPNEPIAFSKTPGYSATINDTFFAKPRGNTTAGRVVQSISLAFFLTVVYFAVIDRSGEPVIVPEIEAVLKERQAMRNVRLKELEEEWTGRLKRLFGMGASPQTSSTVSTTTSAPESTDSAKK
eukprot:Opistho-2@82020